MCCATYGGSGNIASSTFNLDRQIGVGRDPEFSNRGGVEDYVDAARIPPEARSAKSFTAGVRISVLHPGLGYGACKAYGRNVENMSEN